MAKNLYEKALADLREEQMENEFGISNGSMERFFDFLDSEEQERFHEMQELAERKKKWLRLFDRMQAEIASEEFDEALEHFRSLCEDMGL